MRFRAQPAPDTLIAPSPTTAAAAGHTDPVGKPATLAAMASAVLDLATQLAAPLAPDAPPLPTAQGLVPALSVLWARVLAFDAADARWPDRDRFVMAAPAQPLHQALLQLTGHDPHAETPDLLPAPAEAIAAAVGMALCERVLAGRFGKSLVDHRVWAACTAATLANGLAHEAVSLAGLLRLDRLVLVVDATADGAEDARARLACLGWAVKAAAADDLHDIEAALSFALRSRKPTLVWCLPGGRPAPGRASPAAAEAWRRAGARGAVARRGWLKRIARHPQRPEFERANAGRLPDGWHEPIAALRQQVKAAPQPVSPADICLQAIDRLTTGVPELLCGRAGDVLPAGVGAIEPGQYRGRDLCYGDRPHGMAACVNGIALHEGTLPCAAVALADAAAQLPALRLAARLHRRVLHLAFEADEPAPDLLAALRAITQLQLFRPGCAMEAAECLELALRRPDGPSLLVLSRQPLPCLRRDVAENRCARGGYVLAEPDGPRQATLLASGAQLPTAIAACALLAADGVAAAVASLPCWAMFAVQDQAYRESVLGTAPRFAVEASVRDGWDRWLGADGVFAGEATAADLAAHVRRRLAAS